jgi:hypothetical protein
MAENAAKALPEEFVRVGNSLVCAKVTLARRQTRMVTPTTIAVEMRAVSNKQARVRVSSAVKIDVGKLAMECRWLGRA